MGVSIYLVILVCILVNMALSIKHFESILLSRTELLNGKIDMI
jgi:hypothetical protein